MPKDTTHSEEDEFLQEEASKEVVDVGFHDDENMIDLRVYIDDDSMSNFT